MEFCLVPEILFSVGQLGRSCLARGARQTSSLLIAFAEHVTLYAILERQRRRLRRRRQFLRVPSAMARKMEPYRLPSVSQSSDPAMI